MSKSPAFQLYPSDFMSDVNVITMTGAEVGAYVLLMFVCWLEDGLPDDTEELAIVARMEQTAFGLSWEKRLRRCFVLREDGRWDHPRLRAERDKQQRFREKMSEAGSRGGRGHKAKAKGRQRAGIKKALPAKGSAIENKALLSSSSSSITTTTPAERGGWVGRFLTALTDVTKGTYPAGRLGKELKDLIAAKGEDPAFAAWTVFLASADRKYGPSYFAKNYVDYTGGAKANGKHPGETPAEYQFRKRGYVQS